MNKYTERQIGNRQVQYKRTFCSKMISIAKNYSCLLSATITGHHFKRFKRSNEALAWGFL